MEPRNAVVDAVTRPTLAVPAWIAAVAGRMIAPAPSSRFAPTVRYELRALADLKKSRLCPCWPRWYQFSPASYVVYAAAAPTRVQPTANASEPPPVTGASRAPPTSPA